MSEPIRAISPPPEKGARPFPLAAVLMCAQIALLCLLQFGDIGFDHPGTLGLDFLSLIWICVGYVIVLIAGVSWSLAKKRWDVAILQLCIPVALVFYNLRPPPFYDASSHQDLLGKSSAEVERILGTRGRVTGIENQSDGDHEFATYKGMTVKYSLDGRVEAVIPARN